jgi:sigma-B regulation protein RsbU (phosphoserine phosphatase)
MEANEAVRVSTVIFSYASQITGARDAHELLKLNADMARDLVGADRCSIWLEDKEGGQLWTKVMHGMAEIRVKAGEGLVGACVSRGETILVNDAASDPRFLERIDRNSGYRTDAVLLVPLRVSHGGVIGAFQALNKPGGFSVRDVDLLNLAASYSAAAIESDKLRRDAEGAKLLYHELQIARSVQEQLLPKPVQIPLFDCAAACRPAAFVGGDYYDIRLLSDGKAVVVLGDVSGKGISAAVLMASVQASLRSHLAQAPESLAAVMEEFNGIVYATSTQDRYTTLFCGILDIERRSLTYVNCGHIPPMLHRYGGERIERLREGGCPIGLLPNARYRQASVEFREGDRFVCFSDGICEAANREGDMWEELEVESALTGAPEIDARQTLDGIFAAADAFAAGADQSDDMTALVLRCR